MKLTLSVLSLLFMPWVCEAAEPAISLHEEAFPVWFTPIDLRLGDFQPATAEQIFGAPFTFWCESRQITSGKGRAFTLYDWWIRNELSREVSIATVRPPRQTPLLSRVYGAIWATVGQDYPSTGALYGVRTLVNGRWSEPLKQLRRNPNLINWVVLQPKEKKRIHFSLQEGNQPLDALAITIPFRIGEFEDDSILHWVR